jgi:hypothetical protein
MTDSTNHDTVDRAVGAGAGPPRSPSRGRLMVHTVLPVAVGIAAAAVIGADGAIPSALMVCAANYLFAAMTGHPAAAWWALVGTLPLIALGAVLDHEWVSLLALGLAQVVVFVIGAVRGRWHHRHNVLQLVAAVGFGVLAVAAAAGAPIAASVIVIVGLLAHGVWDVVHHHRDIVVSRSYSAFCAGLDAALAVALGIALVTNA